MTYGTTYKICKRLIEIKTFDEAGKNDLQNKLDVFLLNNRIEQFEYDELVEMLDAK